MGAYEASDNGTSIGELTPEIVRVYSPAQGVLTVNAEGNIAIYDVSGRLYTTGNINGATDFSLASGLYIVNIAGTSYKVVVK